MTDPNEGIPSQHEHDEGDPGRVRDVEHRPEPSTAAGSGRDGEGQRGPQAFDGRAVPPGADPLPGLESYESVVAQYASYSGPLLPDTIRGYEQLVPGSAEQIIQAQLVEPERRLSTLADAEISTAKVGQGWAIFLALTCIVASIVFFALGNPIAGGALLGLPLVGLIGSFLPKWHRKDD